MVRQIKIETNNKTLTTSHIPNPSGDIPKSTPKLTKYTTNSVDPLIKNKKLNKIVIAIDHFNGQVVKLTTEDRARLNID